jgi:hypothetical protein
VPFKAAYMFRPRFIQPQNGIRPQEKWIQVVYAAVSPLYPALKAVAGNYVTTTGVIGRAMIVAATRGPGESVIESAALNALAGPER